MKYLLLILMLPSFASASNIIWKVEVKHNDEIKEKALNKEFEGKIVDTEKLDCGVSKPFLMSHGAVVGEKRILICRYKDIVFDTMATCIVDEEVTADVALLNMKPDDKQELKIKLSCSNRKELLK